MNEGQAAIVQMPAGHNVQTESLAQEDYVRSCARDHVVVGRC